MAKYSIKELEALSGVKAHTIRIWEKRYGIIEPARTGGNVRTYSDSDLRRLLNISFLYKKGIKISHIASLSEEELNRRVSENLASENQPGNVIDQLVNQMIAMDEDSFEQTFRQAMFDYGFEKTIREIIYPFFERIGILWLTGGINPAQEHFISNLVRQKMVVAINNLVVVPSYNTKSFLLFLPESEHHELGLLFYTYLIKKHGHQVTYLGQGVSMDELIEVAGRKQADALLTILSANMETVNLEKYISQLSENFRRQQIYLSGYQTTSIDWPLPANIRILKSVDHLHQEMNRILRKK